jgi:hypothetical protein
MIETEIEEMTGTEIEDATLEMTGPILQVEVTKAVHHPRGSNEKTTRLLPDETDGTVLRDNVH